MAQNVPKRTKRTDLTKGKKSNYAWIDCKNMIFFDIMHPFMSQSGAINTPLLEFSYENSDNVSGQNEPS